MQHDITTFWNVYETPFGFGAYAAGKQGIVSILLPDEKWTTDAVPGFPGYDSKSWFFDSNLNGRSELESFYQEESRTDADDLATSLLDWSAFTKSKTGFQKAVLQACARIPRGQILTYGSLAEEAGFTGCARAVGTVMSTNPVPLLIPCHRVVRSDYSVGNYGGGSDMKKFLLQAEGALAPASQAAH